MTAQGVHLRRPALVRQQNSVGCVQATHTARPPPQPMSYTASLSSLAARKATFLLALILIGSPVAGLRPMRAARLRTCRMPRPLMRMRSPFLRCLTRSPTRSLRIVSACFFGTSWVSARDAARCLMVTVVGVAAFAMVEGLPVLNHVVFGDAESRPAH